MKQSPAPRASKARPLARDAFLAVVRDAPLVSIDLVLPDDVGRLLMGLRTNEPARGSWFVPGGRILKDEPLDEAITTGRVHRNNHPYFDAAAPRADGYPGEPRSRRAPG